MDKLNKINKGRLEITYSDLYWNLNRHHLTNQILSIYPDINIKWRIINKTNNVNRILINKTETDLVVQSKLLSNKTDKLEVLDDLSDICVPRLETIDENIKEIHNSILMTSNYIYDLIDIYMEEKYNIIDKEVLLSTKSILKQIVKDNESTKQFEYSNTDWEILRLSFDNMYGYGPGNVLDFTKFSLSEIIGIFADNGMGKSSIIDILCFMLFSRSARDKTAVLPKDIINVNACKSYGELIIKSLGSLYIINRECYRHNERKNK
jgi:hypothetical protein